MQRITKTDCKSMLDQFHYLSKISRGYKSGYNYGLFHNDVCVGCCIFTGFPVPELSKGMLGLERNDQDGLFELSRLVLTPDTQSTEHNITSWFVSRSIKQLRKDTDVRVLLSYADSGFHEGTIYRACNFKYYGLTSSKSDFWALQPDEVTYKKLSRGKTKGLAGEWRPRTRKHRFALLYDKSLTIQWAEVQYETNKE